MPTARESDSHVHNQCSLNRPTGTDQQEYPSGTWHWVGAIIWATSSPNFCTSRLSMCGRRWVVRISPETGSEALLNSWNSEYGSKTKLLRHEKQTRGQSRRYHKSLYERSKVLHRLRYIGSWSAIRGWVRSATQQQKRLQLLTVLLTWPLKKITVDDLSIIILIQGACEKI